MRLRHCAVLALLAAFCALAGSDIAWGQASTPIVKRSDNRPLPSLRQAAAAARAAAPLPRGFPLVVPNRIPKEDLRTQEGGFQGADALTQAVQGTASTSVMKSFDGADNDDNNDVLGFRVAPPDTDGDVSDTYIVQMINLLTTIYDKNGIIVPGGGPFPTNAFWQGIGGLCEPFNQGDPIVLYDETNDRWLVSQFAFDDAFTQFAQCVAISHDGNPTLGYDRYEFSFDDIGLNDYPKHGIVTESITMTANIFRRRGPFFRFTGTFIGVMDKNAMYAGQPGTLVGFNLGSGEFGFVPADFDDPAGTAGFVPALYATAMSNASQFDVWEIDIDWANPGSASANQIAAIPISAYDSDLCSASREACIPQPGTNQQLEAISDRLMHRLQIRDFGSYRTMVVAHTVDVGGGRAGIRWYEMRESGGTWSKHQEGTYAPNDGLYRWMPSVAMNAGGDIGLGYLVSNGTDTFMSTAVTGQTVVNSGSGLMDAAEAFCVSGSGAQTGTARAGDYSATAVDPISDTFWHTNEYGPRTGDFEWATRVCEFEVTGGTGTPPAAPSDLTATAVSTSQIDLTWTDNAGNEDGFEIERSLDNVSFSLIATLGANVISFSDTPLQAATTYYYRVRAFNTNGPSADSNTASATTQSGGGTPTTMHVESVVAGTQNEGQGNKRGTATVTIVDDLGGAVGSATVAGTFSGDFTGTPSEVTGGDGMVTLLSDNTKKGKTDFDFCVDSVTHATLTYAPGDNVQTCASDALSKRGQAATLAGEVPNGYALEQNFPNPFNPVTAIAYTLPEAGPVSLKVFNVLGQEVATLVEGYRDEGRHHVRFDATRLSTGVYIYTIQVGDFTATRRMILLK